MNSKIIKYIIDEIIFPRIGLAPLREDLVLSQSPPCLFLESPARSMAQIHRPQDRRVCLAQEQEVTTDCLILLLARAHTVLLLCFQACKLSLQRCNLLFQFRHLGTHFRPQFRNGAA